MTDISKHTFTANTKGRRWLWLVTLALAALVVFFAYLLICSATSVAPLDIQSALEMIVLVIAAPVFVYALYLDWRTYLYACDTTLEIDMQTMTFTYTHKRESVVFKSTDVWHWYWETGLFVSRIAANHSVIKLQSGKTLFVPCWLFEGNKFFLSDYTKYNACYYIASHREELFFPERESAPNRYNYLLPKED